MRKMQLLIMSFTLCAALLFVGSAHALQTTGVEVYDSFNAPSTNALNYAQLVPGREGQAAPYVLFNTNAAGQVTLDFKNGYVGGAYFEYRIDHNVLTSGTAHPVVTGDYIYDGFWIPTPLALETHTLNATNMVEIRLALGGERDWDFDWTAFYVAPAAPVPIPGALVLFGSGLLGLVGIGRKRLQN